MNTESVLASPLPSRENGNNAGLRHQVEFYASFSRFTRQVLGGGHPHFKLPSTIATSTVASQTIQIQPSSRDDLYTAVSRPAQLAHYMRTTEQAPGKIPIVIIENEEDVVLTIQRPRSLKLPVHIQQQRCLRYRGSRTQI